MVRTAPLAHSCPQLLGEPECQPPLAPAVRRPSNSGQRQGQRQGKALTDAFPSRQSDGVQMAKIQRFVKEQNQQEFFLYCTNVSFFTLS